MICCLHVYSQKYFYSKYENILSSNNLRSFFVCSVVLVYRENLVAYGGDQNKDGSVSF